jgi:hypothetical protein
MAKLELALLVGAESKEWLSNFTTQLDRLEKIQASATTQIKKLDKMKVEIDEEDEDEAPVAKKKAKKKKPVEVDEADEDDDDLADEPANASDDEDDDMELSSDDDEDEESDDLDEEIEEDEDEEPAPKKKVKAKKVTADDLMDAAKARMRREGGKEAGKKKVAALMMKHFKTGSVNQIKPQDYEKFITVMNGK